MLRLFKTLIKTFLFSLAILFLGTAIRWEGKTLSEHVRISAEQTRDSKVVTHTYTYVKEWVSRIARDFNKGVSRHEVSSAKETIHTDRVTTQAAAPEISKNTSEGGKSSAALEELPPSERQKLKALIRELNTPHDK